MQIKVLKLYVELSMRQINHSNYQKACFDNLNVVEYDDFISVFLEWITDC